MPTGGARAEGVRGYAKVAQERQDRGRQELHDPENVDPNARMRQQDRGRRAVHSAASKAAAKNLVKMRREHKAEGATAIQEAIARRLKGRGPK